VKNLVIGDPHIRVQDIPEGWRLAERIKSIAADEGVTQITFMGDLFHNHSIMHVEVMHFWRQVLSGLAQRCPVYIILGNHDGPQEMRPGVHALAALEMQGVTIIDRPYQMMENVWAVPFMRVNDDFVTVCTRGSWWSCRPSTATRNSTAASTTTVTTPKRVWTRLLFRRRR
jgi:DNA repair exonuclease SbcCD nuclease subunit